MIDYKDELEDENKEEFDETFGYRTEELIKSAERIKKNKERYRKQRELNEIFKLRHIGKDYD